MTKSNRMRHAKSNAIFFMALLTASHGAMGQKIYKCGNIYSQQACPDGVIIPAAATPETAQKNARDQATHREALTADRMEKSRLQQEKEDLAANTPKLQRQASTPEKIVEAPQPALLKKRKDKVNAKDFRPVFPRTAKSKKH